MSDWIRREDALSKFEKACTYDSVDKNGMKRGEIKTALTWEGIRKILENIPSAEPERKWIPVTERLPETNDDFLLQFKNNMGVGYYEDGSWSIATGNDLYSGIDECEEKPIAWMPLPEPWRGE